MITNWPTETDNFFTDITEMQETCMQERVAKKKRKKKIRNKLREF